MRASLALVAATLTGCALSAAPPTVETLSAAPPTVETLGGLTLVDQAARGAACLDGSPPGYWMRRATVAADAARWVIHAQGGGWCYDDALCAARAKGRIGSSASWGATTSCYGSCDGILSANATSNPDFAGWNAVFLGYCDGTSFSGNRSGTSPGGLHYRGRANLDAVLDHMLALEGGGLGAATDVVFTGGSAGGLTVNLQLDHVADRLAEARAARAAAAPPSQPAPPALKLRGLADAGLFLDHAAYGANGSSVYTPQMQGLFALSEAVTVDACFAAYAPAERWRCFFAQYAIPHLRTPLFIAEGMLDSWQMGNVLKVGCHSGWAPGEPASSCSAAQQAAMLQYGRDMNATVAGVLAALPSAGAFHSACIVHCQTVFNEGQDRWDAWRVGGLTPREVFGNWYFGRPGVTRAIDAAPYPGNPSCPVWT